MDYLYKKVAKKIDEILEKEKKISINELAKELPAKMRLTKVDVYNIIDELDKNNILKKDKKYIRR